MKRKQLKVADVMTRDVVTVREDDPISRVRRVLQERHFHALPVVDAFDYLVGIVTCADFVGLTPGEEREPVAKLMTRRLYTLPEKVELALVAQFMGKRRVRHVVVVHQGRVRGIVSSYDVLAALGEMINAACGRNQKADLEEELRDSGLVFLDEAPSRPV